MFDLARDDVIGHYWRGLKAFRNAFSYGEPVSKFPGVGTIVTNWLLERGLIETVENPEYRNQTCYRLTDLGYAALKRGQRAKPRPKQPKLKMLEPRIAVLDVRTAKP